MYFVYILRSLDQEHHYIGASIHPTERLSQHNAGAVKSTKPYRPWKIIHLEKYADKLSAYKREFYLKSPDGWKTKKQILKNISKLHGEVA